MFMNLSEVFTSENGILEAQFSMVGQPVEIAGQKYQAVSEVPIRITATHVSEGKAHVEGQGTVTYELHCDRCLEIVQHEVVLDFALDVYAPGTVPEDAEADDQIYMEGYQLNVKALIDSEIMMQWPMKVLCKPECKGICMKCGKNLNYGECGCDTFVPNPRMAAIKDIFNANKEV